MLSHRSAEVALARANAKVVDRYGGTHLGRCVGDLLSPPHGNALRGAVVIIASDGWDSDLPMSWSTPSPDQAPRRGARLAQPARGAVRVRAAGRVDVRRTAVLRSVPARALADRPAGAIPGDGTGAIASKLVLHPPGNDLQPAAPVPNRRGQLVRRRCGQRDLADRPRLTAAISRSIDGTGRINIEADQLQRPVAGPHRGHEPCRRGPRNGNCVASPACDPLSPRR